MFSSGPCVYSTKIVPEPVLLHRTEVFSSFVSSAIAMASGVFGGFTHRFAIVEPPDTILVNWRTNSGSTMSIHVPPPSEVHCEGSLPLYSLAPPDTITGHLVSTIRMMPLSLLAAINAADFVTREVLDVLLYIDKSLQ